MVGSQVEMSAVGSVDRDGAQAAPSPKVPCDQATTGRPPGGAGVEGMKIMAPEAALVPVGVSET